MMVAIAAKDPVVIVQNKNVIANTHRLQPDGESASQGPDIRLIVTNAVVAGFDFDGCLAEKIYADSKLGVATPS